MLKVHSLFVFLLLIGLSCTDNSFTPTTYDDDATSDTSYLWIPLETNTTRNLNRIVFEDTLLGIIVGDNNTILRTSDGGETWEDMDDGIQTIINYYGVHTLDFETIYICGSRFIINSYDGADTWSLAYGAGGDVSFRDIYRHSNYSAVVVGLSGIVFNRESGWRQVEPGLRLNLYRIAKSTPGGVYFVVGEAGMIHRSNDDGITWATTNCGIQATLKDIQLISYNLGYAVGGQGAIIVYNGASWQELISGTDKTLNGLCFMDYRAGVIVGVDGVIIYTSDRGITWNQEECSTSLNLNDVYLHNSGFGIAVGDSGIVLKRIMVVD